MKNQKIKLSTIGEVEQVKKEILISNSELAKKYQASLDSFKK